MPQIHPCTRTAPAVRVAPLGLLWAAQAAASAAVED